MSTAVKPEIKYRLLCQYCNEYVLGTERDHSDHVSSCKVLWESKTEEQQNEILSRQAKILELPTRQTIIKTIDKCKRLLGRDGVLAIAIQPHDIRFGNLIIPADTSVIAPSLRQIMEKSTYARVIKVSETMTRLDNGEPKFPYMVQWRDQIEAGLPGPVVELAPGAGTPRSGDNGVTVLYLHATDIWAEYEEVCSD